MICSSRRIHFFRAALRLSILCNREEGAAGNNGHLGKEVVIFFFFFPQRFAVDELLVCRWLLSLSDLNLGGIYFLADAVLLMLKIVFGYIDVYIYMIYNIFIYSF